MRSRLLLGTTPVDIVEERVSVGKLSYAAMSLVGAIPAGFLSFVMIRTFLNRTETLTTALTVLTGFTLAVSAFVTLLPVGILIFSPKPQETETDDEADSSDESSDDSSAADQVVEDLEPADDEFGDEADDEVVVAAGDELDVDDEFEVEDFGEDMEVVEDEDEEDIFAEGDDDEFGDIDFDDFEDEDDKKGA